MKHNDILPECFIDSTLIGTLLSAKVSHKHSCNEVAKEMEKGRLKDKFAVGIYLSANKYKVDVEALKQLIIS